MILPYSMVFIVQRTITKTSLLTEITQTKKMVENMIVSSVLIALENAIISEEEIHLILIDWNVGMCEVNIWKLSQWT